MGSGFVEPSQAVELAQLHGVDFLVIGAFRSFDIRTQRVGRFGLGYRRTESESSIDVRVIDGATGEVVAASGAEGTKRLGQGIGYQGIGYSNMSRNSPWNPTVAEDALSEAMVTIAQDLNRQGEVLAARAVPGVAAVPNIVGVPGNGTVYIDQGENVGMTIGRRFTVMRVIDVIRDANGNELDNLTEQVGVVEVTRVLGQSSICTLIEGEVAEGDALEAASP